MSPSESGALRRTRAELARVQASLEEAEQALEAIRSGSVDALVVAGDGVERVFTLNGADAAYRILVEAFAEGAMTLLADATIAYCNRHLSVLLGCPLETLIGRSLKDWTAAADAVELDRLLAEGQRTASKGEVKFVRADGTVVPVQLSCNAIELGGSPGVCAIATDLSARRRSEALEVLERQLREADRRKDAFLATLAHELRNPLAPIRTAAQLLSLPRVSGEVLQRSLGVIQRQVRHMALLLDDLLDVARITQGKFVLRREPVPVTTIVDTAVESARPLIDAKRHELVVRPLGEVPVVDGDPLRLAQILSNLLTNAAKYTDPGGRIELTSRVEGEELVLAVEDTGIGIPGTALPAVFEMFSQVQETAGRSDGGLGIGLALVKGLVDLHGGSVEAASAGPGCGSTFTVRLPLLAPASLVAPADPPRSRAAWLESRKVLIADDNVDAADMLAVLLRMSGLDVRVAHGGRAALALAAAYRPDIALLDIGMPDLNGYEVARQFRSEPWGATTLLVALTGWGTLDDKQRAVEAGFDEHMTKPVDADALESLLQEHAAEALRG